MVREDLRCKLQTPICLQSWFTFLRSKDQQLTAAKRFNPEVAAALGTFPDGDIFARLMRILEGGGHGIQRLAQSPGVRVFASGRAEIGQNGPTTKLMHKRYRAMCGPIRVPGSIFPPSKIWSRFIACGKSRPFWIHTI
jgi:hypothetical protein